MYKLISLDEENELEYDKRISMLEEKYEEDIKALVKRASTFKSESEINEYLSSLPFEPWIKKCIDSQDIEDVIEIVFWKAMDIIEDEDFIKNTLGVDSLNASTLIWFRNKSAISQYELADLLEINRKTIKEWETGNKEIPFNIWYDLAEQVIYWHDCITKLLNKMLDDIESNPLPSTAQFIYFRNQEQFNLCFEDYRDNNEYRVFNNLKHYFVANYCIRKISEALYEGSSILPSFIEPIKESNFKWFNLVYRD